MKLFENFPRSLGREKRDSVARSTHQAHIRGHLTFPATITGHFSVNINQVENCTISANCREQPEGFHGMRTIRVLLLHTLPDGTAEGLY